MNTANGGDIIFHFKGDSSNLNNSVKNTSSSFNGMTKSMLVATGVTKAVSAGMNLISSNADSAIKRIDTFNAFPKVLQNFGVSADEAKKSIDRIDQSVRGLPTSLDQAVAGVQDIFMVTKDLKEAESMFKAINDSAMVFANGSTEAVDRFTYAYKQAMSAGKVSAQDFNQMNEAIPGIMDKVAESMGISFVEMKEGLSNGSISMQQFNDNLKKLDSEGGAGMKSLEEVAKTSTGGIATQMTNARTAVVRGVASMIESVNKGLEDSGLGGIGGVVTSAAKTIEGALKSLAPYIVNVIGLIATYLPPIIKLIQKISPILVPLVAGFAAFNAVLKAMSIIKTITTAFAAFNAVLLANPIVLIIAAIVALIAGIIMLYNKCEWFRNLVQPLFEVIKIGITQIIEALKPLITTVISIAKQIMTALQPVIDFIKNIIVAYVKFYIEAIIVAIKVMVEVIKAVIKVIETVLNGIIYAFKKVRDFFVKTIPDKVKNIISNVVNTVKSLPDYMLNIGINIVRGIGNGITNGITWLKNRIKEFVGNITSFIKKVFKIGSPSRLMADSVGQWIPKGIAVGITANTDSVYDAMDDMQNSVLDRFSLSPELANSLHYSPNVIVQNNINSSIDPLGQTVTNIKTFANGSKNDYNYGMGV